MKPRKIGVVVGRFQTPALHEGHRLVIETALKRHKTVLIVLGSPKSFATKRDPLDHPTRRTMLLAEYPTVRVTELPDTKYDRIWSDSLDLLIEKEFPGSEAILYGSRGSFIPHYSGCYKCVTVKPINAGVSATTIREVVKNEHPNSKDFRSGIVYATNVRPPLSYQTVDIAILNHDQTKVLLAGKKEEPGVLRFVGGFVDVTDESLEFTARREVYEETTGTEIGNLIYLGSARINDWRYRGTDDEILTAFFRADYVFGAPRASDDIETLAWVNISELMNCVVEAHKPLAGKLLASLAKERI